MGKILTDSKRLNFAIILALIIITASFLTSLVYVIFGTFLPYHVAFTGKTESNVKAYDAELMMLIGIFIRLLGVYGVALFVANLFVLLFGFRKKEKWGWIYYLFTGGIIFISILILTFPVLGLSMMYLFFIGLTVLWILALAISYKEFF